MLTVLYANWHRIIYPIGVLDHVDILTKTSRTLYSMSVYYRKEDVLTLPLFTHIEIRATFLKLIKES